MKQKQYRIGEMCVRLVRESTIQVEEKFAANPVEAAEILHKLLDDSVVERIYVIYLNGRNVVRGVEQVAQGGLHGAAVSPRDVFRGAILAGANGIILGHNHPSGDPTPSVEDINLTAIIQEAGKVLGIELLDHVIVSPNGSYASLFNLGLMSPPNALSKNSRHDRPRRAARKALPAVQQEEARERVQS